MDETDDFLTPNVSDSSGYDFASPIVLANYHSASVHSVPITTQRTSALREEDYPDYGGSGVFVKIRGDNQIDVHKMKHDSIGTCPFSPKSCSLPLKLRSDEKIFNDFSPELAFNCLNYDNYTGSVFMVDPFDGFLLAHKYSDSNVEQSKLLLKASLECPWKNKFSLCEFGNTFVVNHRRFMHARRWKAVNLIHISSEESELMMKNDRRHLVSDFCDDQLMRRSSFFWKVDHSSVLNNHSAFGLAAKERTLIIDYDYLHSSTAWKFDSGTIAQKSSFIEKPTSLFWSANHPRLLAFSNHNDFGLFDARIKSENSYSSIMNRSRLRLTRDWERIYAAHSLPLNLNQNILVTDHKVILVDNRYPQRNLLQWNHMLSIDVLEPDRFLSVTNLREDTDGLNLITIFNRDQICLITVKKSEPSIVQPSSLHHPLHISKPVDSWNFSEFTDPGLRSQLNDAKVLGVTIVPSPNGFSVLQQSNWGDVFAQDFYFEESSESQGKWSWRSKGAPAKAELDPASSKIVEEAFNNWFLVKSTPAIKDSKSIDARFNCCDEKDEESSTWEKEINSKIRRRCLSTTQLKIRPSRKNSSPTDEQVSDGFTHQSIIDGKFTQAEKLTRMMQSLFIPSDDEPSNWSKYSKDLLEKWENPPSPEPSEDDEPPF